MTYTVQRRGAFATAALAALAAFAAFAPASAALAASTISVSYLPVDMTMSQATYIVDWTAKSHRAHVVEAMVAGDGSYTDDGAQRLVTFDGAGLPTYLVDAEDCNGLPMKQQVEITQMVFRPVSGTLHKGTAQAVEIGYLTDVGGCTPGQQTPFGSPTDPGTSVNNLDMADRASIGDLVPGARLAGPSEDPNPRGWPGWQYYLRAQVTTFGSGTLTFPASGHAWPFSISNGWIVIDFGTFQRGYTRITRNTKTGLENWIIADWQAGAPVDAGALPMVEPNSAAGFGSVGGFAHVWNEGLYMNNDSLHVEYDFYKDHTGLRVFNGDIPDADPVTWSSTDIPNASPVTIRRDTDTLYYLRTWVPLATYGKYHFVMESEDIYDLAGNFGGHNFLPRVNWYIDEGKAVEGTAAVRHGGDHPRAD